MSASGELRELSFVGAINEALHQEMAADERVVVFGEAGGKIIWQPRIGCWYTDKQFAGEPLPAPVSSSPAPSSPRGSSAGCASSSSARVLPG